LWDKRTKQLRRKRPKKRRQLRSKVGKLSSQPIKKDPEQFLTKTSPDNKKTKKGTLPYEKIKNRENSNPTLNAKPEKTARINPRAVHQKNGNKGKTPDVANCLGNTQKPSRSGGEGLLRCEGRLKKTGGGGTRCSNFTSGDSSKKAAIQWFEREGGVWNRKK